MLVIQIDQEELKFFSELISEYPDDIIVKTEHGFDMETTLQVCVDLSEIAGNIVPLVLTTIELVLLYRIQKKQTEISEREAALHEKELKYEQEKNKLSEFEISISSTGEKRVLVRTSDIHSLPEDPAAIHEFVEGIEAVLLGEIHEAD
ncbi:MAG: hypothetical protein Q4C20_13130 [Erysipelotrichaceae bacterium]|nr:hypothetical protein [Erysipelotrichaceae bacterium]